MLARVRRHPLRSVALLAVLVAASALALGGARDWVGFAAFAARAGSLAAIPSSGPSHPVVWTFAYRGVPLTLSSDVSDARLAQDRSLPTDPVFMSGGRLREAYMTTLVRTQAATPLVDDLTRQMRVLRDAFRLDDDEYVEFLAHAVQSIPYGGGSAHVRTVAETLADSEGVCTDKSVMLAALLLHEGYDTGVWVFDTQGHVSVAVRGAGPGFLGSGYAFVETTRPSYIGDADGRYQVTGPPVRAPQLVLVGGTRRYRADVESSFIVDVLVRARLNDQALAPYSEIAGEGTGYWARVYASLAQEHVETTKYAAWLASATDRRAQVFAALTDAGPR